MEESVETIEVVDERTGEFLKIPRIRVFNGIEFFFDKRKKRYKAQLFLARQMWEFYNGKIPKDYQIDHINGCSWDDRIENYACLSISDHSKKTQEQIKTPTGKKVCLFCSKVFNAYKYNTTEECYCSKECSSANQKAYIKKWHKENLVKNRQYHRKWLIMKKIRNFIVPVMLPHYPPIPA